MYPTTCDTVSFGGIEISMCNALPESGSSFVGQTAKYLPNVLTQLRVELFPLALGDEHDRVFCMLQAFAVVHQISFL